MTFDNLCWIYDNNHITIEGHTNITFTEDIAARFLGYGWNVLRVGDARFFVPDGVREHFDAGIGMRGAEARRRWTELFAAYLDKYPELATEIDQMQRRELPAEETCISGSASMRWPPSSMGSRCRSCEPSAPRFSSSAITRGLPFGSRL